MIGQAVNNSRSRRNSHVGNRRVGGDHCPYCGSPISAAVRARIAAAEQAQVAKAEESLRSQFSRERAEAEKKTRLAIEAARKDGAKAAEKAKTEALASERSKFIREKLKLEEQLQQMRRRLENKTPNEFGEEGELLAMEVLKGAFTQDVFEKIKSGQQGADIIHRVIDGVGQICGTIIYDVKNTSRFMTKYLTKLRADQLREGADHAVLITRAFPAGSEQVAYRDGVVIVDPARAVAVVTLLRRQLLQFHTLNLGREDRERKAQAVYEFMVSSRARVLWDQIAKVVDDLRTLDQSERTGHERIWSRRSELYRAIKSATDGLTSEVDGIIAGAEPDNVGAEP